MKTILNALLCLFSLSVSGQSLPNKVDLHTWKPPYTFSAPTGWTSERFPIPIDFAPQIPYKGVEELRFAPVGANGQAQTIGHTHMFGGLKAARP